MCFHVDHEASQILGLFQSPSIGPTGQALGHEFSSLVLLGPRRGATFRL